MKKGPLGARTCDRMRRDRQITPIPAARTLRGWRAREISPKQAVLMTRRVLTVKRKGPARRGEPIKFAVTLGHRINSCQIRGAHAERVPWGRLYEPAPDTHVDRSG